MVKVAVHGMGCTIGPSCDGDLYKRTGTRNGNAMRMRKENENSDEQKICNKTNRFGSVRFSWIQLECEIACNRKLFNSSHFIIHPVQSMSISLL